MTEFTLYTVVMNLIYGLMALLALFGVLRLFDKLIGIRFADMWKEITNDNNTAVAAYLGLRFIGCCLLIGLVIA